MCLIRPELDESGALWVDGRSDAVILNGSPISDTCPESSWGVMLFHAALLLVLIGAAVHVSRLSARTRQSVGETLLLWVLVGYCGLPMIGFMAFGLMRPEDLAGLTGFEPGSPFQTFTAWALLGMGVAATLGISYRGSYLIGPALAWIVFFFGATAIHLEQFSAGGHVTHAQMLLIFATHGLISVVLLAALWSSGLLRPGTRVGGAD